MDAVGYTVLIATHGYDLEREAAVCRKLLEHRVDGVALIGLEHHEVTQKLIRQQGIPALALWNYAADSPLPCVGVDNQEAGYLAAQHVLALGHRNIGTVFPPTAENERARHRQAGALRALRKAGVDTDAWAVITAYDVRQAKQAIVALLRRRADRPTALICGNDVIAQGALFAGIKLGLRIPAELSIIGIGDFPGSAELEPGLTTVHIPAQQIGETAGRYLLSAITEPPGAEVFRCRFEVTLKRRGSTRVLKQRE